MGHHWLMVDPKTVVLCTHVGEVGEREEGEGEIESETQRQRIQ